jgi:tetratricopeptide (TPR) repeat protein
VLQLDPGNSVASGGLEQVAQRTDLTEIEQLRESATAAEAAERWQQAIADYDRVLKLDPNIQFAKDGRARAGDQYRAQVALANIIANPDKLSSPQLFDQAKEILARAQRLSPQGAALQAQTDQVAELIRVYSTQVPVTLESDEVTVVTLSTVGVLGSFEQKQLSLRPGAYTLIGSRNGYRDVRETMLVRPGMAPFVIRCTEKF